MFRTPLTLTRLLLAVIPLCLFVSVNAQTKCIPIFYKEYKSTGYFDMRAVKYLPGGDLLVAGRDSSDAVTGYDAVLLRMSGNGNVIWGKRFGGALNDMFSGICLLNDGSFIIYGLSASFGHAEGKALIARVAGDGTLQWSRQLGSASVSRDRVTVMHQFTDGNIIGSLNINDSSAASDPVVFKMALDGTMLWSRRLDNGSNESFTSIAFDGNTVVAAGFYTSTVHRGLMTRINATDGTLLSAVTVSHRDLNYHEDVNDLEIFNNRISYGLWSRMNSQYPENEITLMQTSLAGAVNFSRLISVDGDTTRISVRRTPENAFVVLKPAEAVGRESLAMSITDGGMGGWTTRLSQYVGSKAITEAFDLTGEDGFVFVGHFTHFLNAFKTSSYIVKTNNIGESGGCLNNSYLVVAGDSASCRETPFTWNSSSAYTLSLNATVAAATNPLTPTTSTYCEKQWCRDITPLPDGCNKSFRTEYSSDIDIAIHDAMTTSDGGKIAVGERRSTGFMMKTKPNGDVEWAKTFNELGHLTFFNRVIKTKDNNILAFAPNNYTINHGVSDQTLMIKLDNNGNIIWSRNINKGWRTLVNDVVVTEDGGFVIICNESYGSPPLSNYVLRYDADGNVMWKKEIAVSIDNPVYRSVTCNATGVYVGYDIYDQALYQYVGFLKMDYNTGDLVWAKRYKINGYNITRIRTVEAINDTLFAFINTTDAASNDNVVFCRLRPDGNMESAVGINRPKLAPDAWYYYSREFAAFRATISNENDFVFADQIVSGTDTTFNVTRIRPDASVVWSHNFPDLKKYYTFNMRAEGKGVLLSGTVLLPRGNLTNFTNSFILKLNEDGNITDNPAASCLPADISFSNSLLTFSEMSSRIDSVVTLRDWKTSAAALISNNVYADADLFCKEPATCNSIEVKGKGNACSMSDTIVYYLENAVHCDVIAKWRYDTSLFKPILITTDTIKLLPKKTGASLLTVEKEAACFNTTEQIPVTVLLSASRLSLGADTTLCQNSPITIDAGAGYASYMWSDNSTAQSLTVSAPGKYYVTVTDNCGGHGSDTITVNNSNSLLKLTGNTTKCNNDTVQLQATAGFTNYRWSPLVNIIPDNNKATAYPSQSTKYYVTTTLWPGCDATDSLLLTVLQSPALKLGADTTVCNYEPVILRAAAGFNSYSWSNGANAANTTVQQPGSYSVSATYSNGCISRDTISVGHYPAVTVTLGKDISVCKDEPTRLSPGNFRSYLWSTGSTSAFINATATGLYWVKVTDNNSCSASDSLNVLEVFDNPKNFLKDTASMCPGDELSLSPVSNYSQYAWQNNGNNKILKVYRTGIYILTVTDNNGCRGTDSIQVYTKNFCPNTIYFPNAFTPNHDTKNETLKPVVTGNIEKYRFLVYNQFGQMIFSSNEPRRGWDGTVSGVLQSNGNYVWVCEYKFAGAAAVTRKGTFLLLK